jgi:hypothetical protein
MHELAKSQHPASEPEPRVASFKARRSRVVGKRNDKRVSGWVSFCCGRVEDREEGGEEEDEYVAMDMESSECEIRVSYVGVLGREVEEVVEYWLREFFVLSVLYTGLC